MPARTDYGYVRLFDFRVEQRRVGGNLALVVAGHVLRQVGQHDGVVVRIGYLRERARKTKITK